MITLTEGIIIALIGITGPIIVALISKKSTKKDIEAAHEKNLVELSAQNQQAMALFEYKLGELKKEVEKHNNIIERTYALESEMKVVKEKISVANNRIADLEDIAKK